MSAVAEFVPTQPSQRTHLDMKNPSFTKQMESGKGKKTITK